MIVKKSMTGEKIGLILVKIKTVKPIKSNIKKATTA